MAALERRRKPADDERERFAKEFERLAEAADAPPLDPDFRHDDLPIGRWLFEAWQGVLCARAGRRLVRALKAGTLAHAPTAESAVRAGVRQAKAAQDAGCPACDYHYLVLHAACDQWLGVEWMYPENLGVACRLMARAIRAEGVDGPVASGVHDVRTDALCPPERRIRWTPQRWQQEWSKAWTGSNPNFSLPPGLVPEVVKLAKEWRPTDAARHSLEMARWKDRWLARFAQWESGWPDDGAADHEEFTRLRDAALAEAEWFTICLCLPRDAMQSSVSRHDYMRIVGLLFFYTVRDLWGPLGMTSRILKVSRAAWKDWAVTFGEFAARLRRDYLGKPFSDAAWAKEYATAARLVLDWCFNWGVPVNPENIVRHVHAAARLCERTVGNDRPAPRPAAGALTAAEGIVHLDTIRRWLGESVPCGAGAALAAHNGQPAPSAPTKVGSGFIRTGDPSEGEWTAPTTLRALAEAIGMGEDAAKEYLGATGLWQYTRQRWAARYDNLPAGTYARALKALVAPRRGRKSS